MIFNLNRAIFSAALALTLGSGAAFADSPKPRPHAAPRPAAKIAAARPHLTAPANDIEGADCAAGRASILCPGYQLVGLSF